MNQTNSLFGMQYHALCLCLEHTYYNLALPARKQDNNPYFGDGKTILYGSSRIYGKFFVASSLYSYHGHRIRGNNKGKGRGYILLNNIRMTHLQRGGRDFVHHSAL